VGFLSRRHDDDALTATGLAKITQAKARPGLEWTSSYDGGTVKVQEGVDLPFGHATIQLRVTPDGGGAEFASEATVCDGDQDHLDSEHLTYVRYDPAHPEQCAIDRERLEREFGPVQQGHGAERNTIPVSVSREWATRGAGGEQTVPEAVPDQTSPPAIVANSADLPEQLSKLGELHAGGVLDDEEFAKAKARLLDGGA
jgi:hypothetical protein